MIKIKEKPRGKKRKNKVKERAMLFPETFFMRKFKGKTQKVTIQERKEDHKRNR